MPEEKIIFTPDSASGRPGTWFLGRFLFWGRSFKRSTIVLRRTENLIKRIRDLIIWLIAVSGWLALIAWIFLNRETLAANPLQIIFFWSKRNPLVLIFLISLWADLFLIYSRSETKAALDRINYRLFAPQKKTTAKTKRYNVAAAYNETAWKSLEEAYLLANKLHQSEVEIIHLFRALLKAREIQNLFIRLNVGAQKLIDLVDHHLVKPQDIGFNGQTELAGNVQEVLTSAFVDAYNLGQKSVGVLNIILFCYENDPVLAEILYELEIDKDKIKNTVEWFRVNQRLIDSYNTYRRSALLKPGTNMNRAYTAIATPTLDHFSHDLTVKAKYGGLDLCVGRQKEITAIFEAFTGGHNGVLLVGPNGVGKSAVINGLAQLMVEEKVPKFLKDKRLVELDVSRLVAGADPSQAEERLLMCINEVSHSGNIILYLDNIENLIGISVGSQSSLDLSEVLAEAISRKNLYCLAAATTENYSHYIENKPIGEVMNAIGVKEPETNEAIQILESHVGFLENKYDIYIVYSAIEQSVVMAARYLHDKFLPLKAINLLEKAAIIASKACKNDPNKCFCGQEEVALAIAEMTGIPVNKISVSDKEKLLHLEHEIHERLVDQEEAVKAVAASLRRARAELKDVKRPMASFLFMGPTGVGKTELAKAVSEIYFGAEDYLIRLDMSEYQNQDSLRKMIGDVDGTLGYLTEAVRKKPFALVLVDEIEKAHPNILNLFLQVLDDGRLTDGQGRTISFTESIIIATSNIGAVYISEQIKAKTSINIIKQNLIDNELNKYLRPELINRFDGIIVFKPLSEEDVFKIAALMLKKTKKNLADKGISLKADKDGVAILARDGYDPKFGARPLRRLLQDRVEDIIANKILGGELKRRDSVIINSRAEVEIEKAAEL